MTTPGQPGWYDDPYDPNAQRYWDGQSWTQHNQPKPASQADLGLAETAIVQQQPPASVPPPTMAAPYPEQPYPQQSYPQQPYPQQPYPQQSYPQPPYQVPPPSGPYGPGQWGPPPTGAAPRRNLLPIILIVSVVAVLVLVVGGILIYNVATSEKPVSDQDKIRTLVHNFTDDFNRSDTQALKSLLCKADGGKVDSLRRLRSEKGPLTTSVSNVTVTGETATAQVDEQQTTRSDSEVWNFGKESGAWKVCPSLKHGH